MEGRNAQYGATILRVFLAALFIVPGIGKLINPAGIIGMLSGLGFPAASFFGWIVLLSEIIFGLALLVGWKVKYTTWPLIIILIVATLIVHIPAVSMENPMTLLNVLFHLIGIAGLINIFLTGAGAWAVDKN
ncbi:MAG: DoxX family protein [Nanoarchaeota archaeon]